MKVQRGLVQNEAMKEKLFDLIETEFEFGCVKSFF